MEGCTNSMLLVPGNGDTPCRVIVTFPLTNLHSGAVINSRSEFKFSAVVSDDFSHVLHLNAGLNKLRNKDWFSLEHTPSFYITIYVFQCITVSSYEPHSVSNRVTLVYVQPFVLANIKEGIKALRYWPFFSGESTDEWWFLVQRASNAENASIYLLYKNG